jgi:hypothetical protein
MRVESLTLHTYYVMFFQQSGGDQGIEYPSPEGRFFNY